MKQGPTACSPHPFTRLRFAAWHAVLGRRVLRWMRPVLIYQQVAGTRHLPAFWSSTTSYIMVILENGRNNAGQGRSKTNKAIQVGPGSKFTGRTVWLILKLPGLSISPSAGQICHLPPKSVVEVAQPYCTWCKCTNTKIENKFISHMLYILMYWVGLVPS